jgi:hypothetical protein
MFKRLATDLLSLLLALPVVWMIFTSPASAEAALILAEEPGCIWCKRWNSEIGPIYPKTSEGQAAPLRRINILEPVPEGITLSRRVSFTPTFILTVDGLEQSRIEGYPEEHFFWGLLGQMLIQAGIPFEVKTSK